MYQPGMSEPQKLWLVVGAALAGVVIAAAWYAASGRTLHYVLLLPVVLVLVADQVVRRR